MKKVALITGITGQDGAYLAEFLLKKGYVVHGIKRRTSLINTQRIDHIYVDPNVAKADFSLHYGDMTDSTNLIRIIQETQPDEIYNLAAMSHVHVSFETPEYTANADAIGALRILEAIRLLKLEKKTKFYQASTSELYGKVVEIPQTETTPFYPRSPYAAAKLYAYWITVNYREAYNFFASNGILFNHESPIRGETFVTRKITIAIARMLFGLQQTLYLGNLDAKRDWGHAKDYVRAMWMMLQHSEADDFVVATGKTTSIKDFITKSFDFCGIGISFSGKDEGQTGTITSINTSRLKELNVPEICLKEGQDVIKVNPRYYRPTEVDILIGDPSKAKKVLGWEPKLSLENMIEDMILSDIQLTRKDKYLKDNGFYCENRFE